MIHKNGVVDKVARHGKAFTLVGESIWYTAFAASQLNGASSGDAVEFTFQESVKAGTTWNNIKNDVRITSSGGGSTMVLPSGGGTPAATPAAMFGAMTLSKDRSIARQNACNVAANIIKGISYLRDFRDNWSDDTQGDFNAEKIAHAILDVARIIEAYTTGDLDKAEALAKLEGEEDAE